MTYLTKAVNGINNFLKSDGTGNCMEYISKAPSIRIPAQINDRCTEITNQANRRRLYMTTSSKKRKTRDIECGACRFYQETCVFGHREYSTKCPQKNQPHHAKKLKEALEAKKRAQTLSQAALSQSSLS
jgi:hypothetical protein